MGMIPHKGALLMALYNIYDILWKIVGRLRKKSCTLGCKHGTWYNYSLRNANKYWKGTQAAGHPYDLFLGYFRSKTDIFGDFTYETLSLI